VSFKGKHFGLVSIQLFCSVESVVLLV